MLEPNDLKKGAVFKYQSSPFQVLDYSHTHKGRGSATVSVKVRDLISGSVLNLTFKAGDKIDEADIERRTAQFLYQDDEGAHFMDTESYEQTALSGPLVSQKLYFLTDGQEVNLILFEGRPFDVDLPPKVELKVMETEPGVKGDTASGTAYKPAVLETGYQINVPLFVKQGDIIRLNTETGEYVERV